ELMPPTLITRDLAAIKEFRTAHGDIVMKPLYGKGGEAVFRLAKEDLNFGSLYDLFATMFREPWVVQKFLPAVKDGDKRIILVDGDFAGAVNRVPAPDDLRSNMVRGGVPKATDLAPREREICARLGPALARRRRRPPPTAWRWSGPALPLRGTASRRRRKPAGSSQIPCAKTRRRRPPSRRRSGGRQKPSQTPFRRAPVRNGRR